MNIDLLTEALDKPKAIALMKILARKFKITVEEFDLTEKAEVDTRVWVTNNYWEQTDKLPLKPKDISKEEFEANYLNHWKPTEPDPKATAYPTPSHYTICEGGAWQEWYMGSVKLSDLAKPEGTESTLLSVHYIKEPQDTVRIHALKFAPCLIEGRSNERMWDCINGWRD